MKNLTITKEKFWRVKANMESIKKASVKELNKGRYTPLIVATMVLVVEVLDDMLKDKK